MNKGIVMETSDQHVIVMTPKGTFHKLPRDGRTCDVGEEIVFAPPPAVRRMPAAAKISGLAAAAVIAFVVFTGANWSAKADVVAYVSMDINPSVEFGINATEKVMNLQGLNDDGTKLIAGVDYKGKTLENVAEELLDKAEQLGPLAKGEGDIIIASSLVKNTDELNDTAIADKLKQQVQKHIQADHPDQAAHYEVTAFAAPQEVRTAAEQNGLSMGKYALYLTAKSNGTDLPLDDFKKESVLELAKNNGGLESFVNPQQPPAKAQLKQLLEEEKSGKLDELAKQLAEQKGKSSETAVGQQKQGDKNDKKSAAGKNDDKNSKQSDKKDTNNKDDKNQKKDNRESNAKPTSSKPADGNAAQDSYIKKGESDNQKENESDTRKYEKNKSDDSSDSEKKTNRNKTNFDNGDSKDKKHSDDHGGDGGSD